jgi:CheY-like chemotaxis protein
MFGRVKQRAATKERSILVVDANAARRRAVRDLFADAGITVYEAESGGLGLERLARDAASAAVLGIDLGDMRFSAFVHRFANERDASALPFFVYSPGEIATEDEAELARLSKLLIVRHVRSPERLLDETTLFLHKRIADLPDAKRAMVERLHDSTRVLSGKRVLIVDDDIRNIFALTVLLEAYEMKTLSAETGRSAIEILERTPDIDVVLMDMMMPEMDGYDTIRAIRARAEHRSLPIIAVTAKAYKGDREKCLEAGATDYASKPVDPDQIAAMLRVRLHR